MNGIESLLHRHIRNDKTPENVKVFRGFVFSGGAKKARMGTSVEIQSVGLPASKSSLTGLRYYPFLC